MISTSTRLLGAALVVLALDTSLPAPAAAIVGRPATPMSYAGVARRSTVYHAPVYGAPVAAAAVVTTTAVVAASASANAAAANQAAANQAAMNQAMAQQQAANAAAYQAGVAAGKAEAAPPPK